MIPVCPAHSDTDELEVLYLPAAAVPILPRLT
jgi:hypothetical protein